MYIYFLKSTLEALVFVTSSSDSQKFDIQNKQSVLKFRWNECKSLRNTWNWTKRNGGILVQRRVIDRPDSFVG